MENDGRGSGRGTKGAGGGRPASAEAPRGRGERCGAGGQLGFGWDPRGSGSGTSAQVARPLAGWFVLAVGPVQKRSDGHMAWQRFSSPSSFQRDRKCASPCWVDFVFYQYLYFRVRPPCKTVSETVFGKLSSSQDAHLVRGTCSSVIQDSVAPNTWTLHMHVLTYLTKKKYLPCTYNFLL
jgi:hypothetical protein